MITTSKRTKPAQIAALGKASEHRAVEQAPRLPYDIASAGDVSPVDLADKELANLKLALGRQPTEAFLYWYRCQINTYIRAANSQAMMTPEKVSRRLDAILCHAKSLNDALIGMEASDHIFIDRFFTQKFLRDLPTHSVNGFLRALALFLPNLEGAVSSLSATQKRGAMPAFPQQMLAQGIAEAFYLESGKFPALTRGKAFEKVLICALNTCDKRNGKVGSGRKSVMPLMQHAKMNFNQDEARKLAEAIKGFVAKSATSKQEKFPA